MSAIAAKNSCIGCDKSLVGASFVRALGGFYHTDCFKCEDCGVNVASRFFPWEDKERNRIIPCCETDYFKRLNLLCSSCNLPLRGSHITAGTLKYHSHCFCCSVCKEKFGSEESYYDQDGNVFCAYHYAIKLASKCIGCKNPIVKGFVNEKSVENEQWHPDCYMLSKCWNIRMASDVEENLQKLSSEEYKLRQQIIDEKISRILAVLSAYEESSAACISDMLLHFSNGSFSDGINEAANLIFHVEVLYGGIDLIIALMAKHNDNIGISNNKEPKALAKKVVALFSGVSRYQQSTGKDGSSATLPQDLLSMVTYIAQLLKTLIRFAITGALRLERTYSEQSAIGDFLNKLVEVGQREEDSTRLDYRRMIDDIDVTSDACVSCKLNIEEACINFGPNRWHKKCFKCSITGEDLSCKLDEAYLNKTDLTIFCKKYARPEFVQGFDNVSLLLQYSFLLKIGLKRLICTLKVRDDSSLSASIRINRASENSLNSQTIRRSMLIGAPSKEVISGSGPVLTAAESPNAANISSVHNLVESAEISGSRISIRSHHGSLHGSKEIPIPKSLSASKKSISVSLPDIQNENQWALSERRTKFNSSIDTAKRSSSRYYLADLTALEYFVVRHVCVLKLQPLCSEFFTTSDLLDTIRNPKSTLWSKIMATLKPSKRISKVKEEATFGVPLATLMEKSAVESKHGRGIGRLRIPSFVEQAITALKGMNLNTEGIFRKNGNIKNLLALQSKIDLDPTSANLDKEPVIQVAALLKKFFREMPEPLLTFKLFKLFLFSQKLKQEERVKMLHYTVCLLPKANRDVLEVILAFLRDVATLCVVDENNNENNSSIPSSPSVNSSGNKMDLMNLATVFAPNILYSNAKQSSSKNFISPKDESMLAIQAVLMLLEHQDEMLSVPDDVAEAFTANNVLDKPPMDADPKIILKQFETILAAKKNVAHLVSAQGTYPEGNVAVPENGSGTNEVSTFSKKNT